MFFFTYRDFSLMVKHVTFNHYFMGSSPISLKFIRYIDKKLKKI